MRKGQFSSLAMKNNWKDFAARLLNKLKHSLQLNMARFIFPFIWPQTQNGGIHQVVGRSRAAPWSSGVACEKISATTSTLTSDHMTFQITILLIIMSFERLRKKQTEFYTKRNTN